MVKVAKEQKHERSKQRILTKRRKYIFRSLNRMDEGLKFKQPNFRMAGVSNLKINKRSNVEGQIYEIY